MNAIVKQLEKDSGQIREWFEHLHRNPELSMQEARTAEYIAEQLRGFGAYEVVTGVGKHGIVATLKVGDGDKAIGLRADFDALPIQEQNGFPINRPSRAYRICAVMTAKPPCCWGPPGIWPRPETSIAPSA